MKNQSFMKKVGDFVLGRGFYIVLFLCVATIGVSGYYLLRTAVDTVDDPAPVGGGASVTLPDTDADRPAIPIPDPAEAVKPPAEVKPDPAADEPAREEPAAAEQPPEDEGKTVSNVFTWPVKGAVLRDYAMEVLALDPTMGDWRTHGGLDLAAAQGVKVLSISAGTVDKVYEDGLMGHTVVVDHGGGLQSWYCNLAEDIAVSEGDQVAIGDVLGTVGSSAIAEAGVDSHLHLETVLDGQVVDPKEYLK